MKGAALMAALALGLEALRLSWFGRLPAQPDFLLGLTVIVALARGAVRGATAGLLLGGFRDLLYGEAIGVEALPLTLAGWLVGSLGRSVYREAALTQGVVLFLAALGKSLLVFLFLRGGEAHGEAAYLIRTGVPAALSTAILVPLLIQGFERATRTRLRFHERKILVRRG